MMNIIVDENINFAEEAFGKIGNVSLYPGRNINNRLLKDCDVLIVRSVTEVNSELINNTPVQFIGTATIGTDHIDTAFLREQNIVFASAKGCNSNAVSEFVFSSLLKAAAEEKINLIGLSIGIIGYGHIGKLIAHKAKALGLNVLINDPPLQKENSNFNFQTLEETLEADIITFHVPLTLYGEFKTYHLLNEELISSLSKGKIIINTSRGGVIDNNALSKFAEEKNFKIILDVWENEPNVNLDLLKKTKGATPHIAGYSLEGKVNGTKIIYDSLCNYLKLEANWEPYLPAPKNAFIEIDNGNLPLEELLDKIFSSVYDIKNDDLSFRKILHAENKTEYFDQLRKDYPMRREFCSYTVKLKNKDEAAESILSAFGFKII